MRHAITLSLAALLLISGAALAAEPTKTGVLAALDHPDVQSSAVAELLSSPAELSARMNLLKDREKAPAVARKGAPGAVDDAALRSGPAFRVLRETTTNFALRLATLPGLLKTDSVAAR